MRSLWLANAVNIVLDPCLIFGWGPFPEMGLTGAAVATTIGRGIGVAYQVVMLVRPGRRLSVAMAHARLDPLVMRTLLPLASMAMLQGAIESASWIGLIRILAGFGSDAVAGYTIAIRVAIFALLPSFGLANAAATLVGQNLGAAKPERAERSAWLAAGANSVFLGSVSLFFIIFPEPIVGSFTDEAAIIPYAVVCLRTVSFGFLFYAFGMVLVQSFNGAGDTRTPMLLNLVCFWLIKIPGAYVLAIPLGLGPLGVFVAVTVAYSTIALAAVVLFRQGHWKLRHV
jgi:putative MATE family efflux protein